MKNMKMIVEFGWKEEERIRWQIRKDHCIYEMLRDIDFILMSWLDLYSKWIIIAALWRLSLRDVKWVKDSS